MAASAGIILPGQTAAATTVPASGTINVFSNSAAVNAPYYLDSLGVAHPIGSGASGVIDVTQPGPYVASTVTTGNSGATNNTNLTAIMTAAPSGSVLYFPGGFYTFNSNIAVPAKVFTFQGAVAGINGSLTGFVWGSNVAGDLITLTSANYYSNFRDILFSCSVSQSAGSVVNTNGNANTNFYRCVFSGLSSSSTLFNCINYNGTQGGNSSVVDSCQFFNFTGTGIIGGCNTESFVIDKCVINGGITVSTGAAAGINITIGGAIQIDNTDVIGCTNNLLINPTVGNVVASVFCCNTYFDNAFGSCIKISGAGATVRSYFVGCSFTTAASAAGSSAVEISTTVAAGAQGIDFLRCNVLNTFATTGTTNGFLITGAADYSIVNCRVAGWTNGLNLTPHTTAAATIAQIIGNIIGTSGGYGVNTVGILLNAGAATYGALEIQNNDCSGNTTALTNNLTTNIPATSARYRITDNAGINPKGTVTTPGVPVAGTTVTNTTGYRIQVVARNGATAPAAIVVNGVSTANHNATVTLGANVIALDPGGTIAFTTTTASGWTWIAN